MASPQRKSAGYRAFLAHLDALRTAITDPGHLATQLYSAGLITQLAHQRAGLTTLAPLERSNELLTALDGRLATDDGAFDKFLSVLSSDPVMEEMCSKIRETRGERTIELHVLPSSYMSNCMKAFNEKYIVWMGRSGPMVYK